MKNIAITAAPQHNGCHKKTFTGSNAMKQACAYLLEMTGYDYPPYDWATIGKLIPPPGHAFEFDHSKNEKYIGVKRI